MKHPEFLKKVRLGIYLFNLKPVSRTNFVFRYKKYYEYENMKIKAITIIYLTILVTVGVETYILFFFCFLEIKFK